VAVKAIAEEAKAKKDEILASDGYKETLAKLSTYIPRVCPAFRV